VELGMNIIMPATLESGDVRINAGQNLAGIGVTDDFAGVARPQGAAYDIGAFELPSGTTPFNFALSNAGDQTVIQGQSVPQTVTVTKTAGTASAVSFSPATVTGLPTNASISFSPTSCTPTSPCTSVATIQTQLTTPQGSFVITITGTAGALVRPASFTLTVTCP
jgi:hypothetical protein